MGYNRQQVKDVLQRASSWGFWKQIQPIQDFVEFSKPSTKEEAVMRLEVNLKRFWANYACIGFGFFVFVL